METIFITNQFKTGGVERVFLNIANNTSKKLYLFPIHANYDKGFYDAIPSNVEVIQPDFKLKRNLFDVPKLIVMASRINKRFGKTEIRAINFSDNFSTLLVSFLIKAKEHLSWIHCNPAEFPKSKLFPFYRYLFKKCKNVVCLCERQSEVFKKVFSFKKQKDLEKIVICKNLLDIKRIDAMKNESVDVDFKYILKVARFDFRSKDYYTLISAYEKLGLGIIKNVKLLLLGDGADEQKIRDFIHLKNLDDYVILPGADSNPYKWFHNAEFSVLSSTNEGYPMVVVESLACECPIISSNCDSGPSDILDNGKYGLLFEVGNVQQLYEAMLHYLTEKSSDLLNKDLLRKRVLELNEQSIQSLQKILN